MNHNSIILVTGGCVFICMKMKKSINEWLKMGKKHVEATLGQ